MVKRIVLLIGVILGICGVFYFADKFSSPVLWIIGFVAVSTLMRYGSVILVGGNTSRVISYFKHHPRVRIELIHNVLARKQADANNLTVEELVALLTISMAQESIDIAHNRASEYPIEWFNDDFFGFMLQVSKDVRIIGLSREFQIQLAGFGESLAKKYKSLEWADEFHKQRELIFKRHAESILVIRAR